MRRLLHCLLIFNKRENIMSLEESIDGLASSINALAMAITANREAETVVVKAPVTEKTVEPKAEAPVKPVAEKPKKTKAVKKEEPVAEAEVVDEPVAGTEWDLKALQQRTLEVFKINAEAVMQALKDRKAAKVQFLPKDQWGDFAADLTKIEEQANG